VKCSTGAASPILARFSAIWFLSFRCNQRKAERATFQDARDLLEAHWIGRRISQLGRPTSKMYWTGLRIYGLRQR
jgi:hypothetical protein